MGKFSITIEGDDNRITIKASGTFVDISKGVIEAVSSHKTAFNLLLVPPVSSLHITDMTTHKQILTALTELKSSIMGNELVSIIEP